MAITIVEVDSLTRQLVGLDNAPLMVLKAKDVWSDRMFCGFVVEDKDGTKYQYNRETKAFEVYVPEPEQAEG